MDTFQNTIKLLNNIILLRLYKQVRLDMDIIRGNL